MKTIKHFMGNTFNVGDSVISGGIDKILHTYIKGDFELIKIHATSSCKWQNFKGISKETVNFIKRPDLIIIGGHPLIGKKDSLEINSDFSLEELPCFLMGVGALIRLNEENMEPDYIDYIKPYLSKFKAISTRDEESYKFIKKFNENTFLTGDPGFFIYEKEFKYNDSDYVVISFNGEETNSKFYETLVLRLKKLGLKIFLITHDVREIKQVSFIAKKCDCYYLSSPNYNFYVPFIENSRFVITFRLHGAILASTLGVPFINIYYDIRGEDFEHLYDKNSIISIKNVTSFNAKVRKNFSDKARGRINESFNKFKINRFKIRLSVDEKDLVEKIMEKVEKVNKKQTDYSDHFNSVKIQKQRMIEFMGYIDKYI